MASRQGAPHPPESQGRAGECSLGAAQGPSDGSTILAVTLHFPPPLCGIPLHGGHSWAHLNVQADKCVGKAQSGCCHGLSGLGQALLLV